MITCIRRKRNFLVNIISDGKNLSNVMSEKNSNLFTCKICQKKQYHPFQCYFGIKSNILFNVLSKQKLTTFLMQGQKKEQHRFTCYARRKCKNSFMLCQKKKVKLLSMLCQKKKNKSFHMLCQKKI